MIAAVELFDRAFQEVYHVLPDLLCDPEAISSKEKVLCDFSEELEQLQHKCRQGISIIFSEEEQLGISQDQMIAAKEEWKKVFSSVPLSPIFTKLILKIFGGASWREALSVSKETLDVLYMGAKAVFEAGRFEEAISCFTFLCWFDSKQYDFWLGLAHSQFRHSDYQSAVSSYGVASGCVPEESWPHIYAAASFEALGDLEQASISLRDGIAAEKAKQEPDALLLQSLSHKLDEYQRGFPAPTT